MSDSPLDTSPSRDYARITLVICCLLATVLATALLPTLTSGDVVDSPAGSMFPGEPIEDGADVSNGTAGTDAEGPANGSNPGQIGGTSKPGGTDRAELGALNPGDRTDVGGNVDVGDNPYQSQDTAVHMTVRSTDAAYWRTGAYDSYTGSGWEQTGDSRPYAGGIEENGVRGSAVEYRVTLNRSATAVPTVWQPRRVRGLDGLAVTDGTAIRSDEPLTPGTSYAGRSLRPIDDPRVLQSMDRDYPDRIEQRYARAPGTSERLERLTENITANAETPYEEAVAIEQWLESNKAYSLDVSRTSDDMAETFVFDMERGYCEYFATSMVVMLRSQDIPARYVVGYSTGQEVEDNTYRVRGMNAHAWVEVYFEDVGWVKFDPTPGGQRLRQERQSLRQASPDEPYSPPEQGSPGEELTPTGDSSATTRSPSDDPSDGNGTTTREPGDDGTGPTASGDGYDVSLNRSAVPGVTVRATVTRDGAPVVGRTVMFNGEPVGTTDANGVVTGDVPYATELRITVADEDKATLAPPGGSAGLGGDRLYSVEQGGDDGSARIGTAGAVADVTVPVETNATITVDGDVIPGETVTVTATVADVPVRDGAVFVDGQQVATTDSAGQAPVTLPESPGEVRIGIERDPIRAETTVRLPDLELSVRPRAPIALPLTGATVEVRAGDVPVSGVPIQLDGQRVATTGVNGTASVSLPLAPSASVSVTANGLTRETTVQGLFRNLFLVFGVAVLIVSGVVAATLRWRSPRELVATLRRLPGTVLGYATWLLVVAARRSGDAIAIALTRLRASAGSLLAALRGRITLRELWNGLHGWVLYRYQAVRETLGDEERTTTAETGAEQAGGTATEDTGRAYRNIRTAWSQFLDRVSVRQIDTKTPGELARHATERDGLPPGPVDELRDAFREVEYGARSPDDRLERVERAIEAIERARGVGETRSDGGSRTGDGDTDSVDPEQGQHPAEEE